MMRHKIAVNCRYVFAIVIFCSGCGREPREIPQFDYTGTTTYKRADFKDDATTNTTVDEGSFPQTFVNLEGKTIDLTQYRGKKKVVLVVLRGIAKSERGGFCPSCLAQTASLSAHLASFEERGAVVLVVFPGPSERVTEFVQSVKAQSAQMSDPFPYMLLDCECIACDRLGIRDDLAKPSTYVLNLRGSVVYAYVGETSTDRPSVKAILSQLDRIK